MGVMFLAHHGGIGGASLSLLELAMGLRERRLGCEIIVPRPGFLSRCCEQNSVPIRIFESDQWAHLAPVSPRLRLRKLLGHSWRALKLARLLKKWRCRLLISNNLTLCEGALACALAGIPHIAYVREFGDLDYGVHFEWGTQNSLALLSRLSRRTIFNSQAVADYFARAVKKATGRVVYNAVTVPETSNQPGESEFRCVLVGSLHPGKGQFEAVQAMQQLGPAVRLDLIGPEMDQAYVQQIQQFLSNQELAGRVRLLGMLPPAQCYEHMAGADVVLMCSRMEAFGRVTVEAMKLGRPVIGAASGGTVELIDDGVTGVFYPPGDATQLAARIARLETNREYCRRLGAEARRRSLGRFTRETYAEAVHAIVLECLESSPPAGKRKSPAS